MWLHPGLGGGGGRRSKILDIESLVVCSQAVCLFVGAVITKAAAISALLLCKSVEHIWSLPLKTPSMLLGKNQKLNHSCWTQPERSLEPQALWCRQKLPSHLSLRLNMGSHVVCPSLQLLLSNAGS